MRVNILYPAQETKAYGRASRKGGFTLIELLVVTAILGVVIGAIGACLAGGIRVWDVARRFNRYEADALMSFQLMRRDMGQVLPFESAPLEGATDGLRFTGVGVVPVAGQTGDALPRLARIRYYLDYEREAWCRAVAPFDWGEIQAPEFVEVLVSDVDRVALRYAAAPEATAGSATVWSDSWENPTNLPAVVEAELSVKGTSMTQWFIVPLAGGEG